MSGFGNEFATEAVRDALPHGQNSPQQAPLGLYAEQISGTAFTAPRHANRRSWLYRIRPAAMHHPFEMLQSPHFHNDFDEVPATPNQLRWDPLAIPRNADRFRRWPVHDGGQRQSGGAVRCRHPRIRREQPHARPLLLQRRCGNGDRAAARPSAHRHGNGRARSAAAGSRGDSARRAFSRRIAGWPGARLRRREFRRASASAGTGSDRLERSGECARFPYAGRVVRRSRRRIRTRREIPGPAVVGAHRSFAARRRRAGTATTRRTNTICACSTRSARSATTIPIRRSSPCSPRRAIRRAWRTWIS